MSSSPIGTSGQIGIALREALVAGEPARAAREVASLDEAHRVELLLGGALRDGRDDFAAVREFLALEARWGPMSPAEHWLPLTERLASPDADPAFDEWAAGLVAARMAPDRFRADGAAWPDALPLPAGWESVCAALGAGVGGLAVLDALGVRRLSDAVAHYYRRGTIHALGVRPLLICAAVG